MKKKAFIVSIFLIILFSFAPNMMNVNANESNDIIGYSIDSNRNESFLYENDLHSSMRNYTDSTIDNVFFEDVETTNQNNGSRAIIDDDNRVILKDYQYTQQPYRSICRIVITFNEISNVAFQGTGFLVGPHTILTNCHVLYDCSNDHNYGWFDTISISFGTYKNSNGEIINPYGTITQFTYASCGSFRDTGNVNDDWALLDLNVNIGNELGYFGVTAESNDNDSVRVVGYSGDLDRKMAYSNGVIFNVNTYKFDHNCDVYSGGSGSPVIKNSNNLVCGIHSGYSYYWFFGDHYTNHACKISNYIVAWVEERL